MIPNKLLVEFIEREKAGQDFVCPVEDRPTLLQMLNEINAKCNANINYLAELDALHVIGAGEIICNYIDKFTSESVKAYLIPQLTFDKIKNCDIIILQMYLHFRESKEYISEPEKPSPSHICSRYDNAFYKLKSKRIVTSLLGILHSPRDLFYLPLTAKMLASWRVAEFEPVLINYLIPNAITMQDVGLYEDGRIYYPPFDFIHREIKFSAINGLGYYHSEETVNMLYTYTSDTDKDIQLAASKAYRKVISKQ